MKRFISLILTIIAVFAFAGCNKLAVEPEATQPEELFIEEDLICGFYLTFEKNGEFLTDIASDNFESDDAVKFYMDKKKFEDTNSEYIEIVIGKDVLFDCKTSNTVLDVGGTHLVRMDYEAKLYYTYELVDSIMQINPLYMDEKLNKVYAKEESVATSYQLPEGIQATASYSEEKSTSRTVDGVKEELKYVNSINVSFECIDKLTEVRIIEFDKNNNLLCSSIIDAEEANYTADSECEYLVVEEIYQNKNGESHTERSLFERSVLNETAQQLTLKMPLGNGLVSTAILKIQFA